MIKNNTKISQWGGGGKLDPADMSVMSAAVGGVVAEVGFSRDPLLFL